MTVPEALQWYALQDKDNPDDPALGDVVTLCTVHAAKGLEWPAVVLVEVNEGSLPSSQAIREDADVPEERRVCYVGMTRAKEALIVHYRRPEDQDPTRKAQKPSRFLVDSLLLQQTWDMF
jgi:DNA helicase-2/ATP-dependent DNA helicase PcrA